MENGDIWLGREAGPVVRPYALTGGRTEPADGEVLDLVTVVVAAGPSAPPADPAALRPEHRTILRLCQDQVTVADIAASTNLPVGVVRVLLSDLRLAGQITVVPPASMADQPSSDLLKEVLHGLRAL